MFKIVVVVDKKDTAIDRLAQGVKPYMDGFDYVVCDVHPKRPDPTQLLKFEAEAKTADVIDYQYFRTAEMLKNKYDFLENIPSLLTHHNPYSINESKWVNYDRLIANNKTIQDELILLTDRDIELIPLAVDPYFWKFNENYNFPRKAIMVANRIEAKKGILPVAKACKEIGAKLILVGSISDMDYFKQVMDVGSVEFAQNISDEELRDLYHQSGVHVCNSIDNFESGTMPILEAIFCGVPVLTRRIGHVPDIYDGENLVLQESDPEDVENIASKLNEILTDKKKTEEMRHNAWLSIKDRNPERRAVMYQRIYRSFSEKKPVSVIMPVADRPDVTKKSVEAVLNQTYKNLDLIIIDDGNEKQKEIIQEIQSLSSIPIKYLQIKEQGYNLAKARNLGIIHSTSDILVFCDQRMVMEPDAVEEFVKNLKARYWLYGSKGVKKDFVENFSCIDRNDIVTLGMFNERITGYGGQSQECRARARRQGFNLHYLESAKAVPAGRSGNKKKRKIEIMESKNLLWRVGLQ